MDFHKIIIVGESNICRSFMAETILRGILQEKNCPDVEVISRGMVVLFSEPVAREAERVLRENGYKIEEFRSAQLTEEEILSADLVLAVTKELAEKIRESFDVQQTSCMSIGMFADMEEDMPDATAEEPETFRNLFETLEPLMEAAADRIIGEVLN